MSDPTRWIETQDAELRSTLDALSTMEPTSEAKEAVWAKIAMTLPGGPGGGSAPGSGGAGSSFGALKIGAGLMGAIAISVAAIAWMSPSSPVVNASVHSEKESSAIAVIADPGEPVDTVTARAIQAILPVPKRAPAPAPASTAPAPQDVTLISPAPPVAAPLAVDGLREEAAAVRKARQSLRAGDALAALRELERIAARAPNGPLEEEREVLTIEALRASGDTEAARRRADRFLFERPQSMHAARVRTFADATADN